MKYLVTGGLGFIGSHFIEEVLQDDKTEQVLNIDVGSYAANKNFRPSDTRYSCLFQDVGNYEALSRLPMEYDVVVNFASHSHVDNSIETPNAFLNNNINSFFNFLKICREGQLAGKIGKFIHISTDEVFGDVEDSIYDYFIEKSDLRPSSPYSASKASQEMFIHTARKMFGFKANILRLCNNYGPRQFEEKFIPVIIKSCLNDQKIPVYGDGQQKREWIFVKDAVRRIKKVALSSDDCDDYCIGSNDLKTNLELIEAINNLTGNSPRDNVEFVADRVGHDRVYKMDSRKFNFKYSLTHPCQQLTLLTDGLKDTLEYFEKSLSHSAIAQGDRP
jgi:dTDP-glucose 4,6-dehydratase